MGFGFVVFAGAAAPFGGDGWRAVFLGGGFFGVVGVVDAADGFVCVRAAGVDGVGRGTAARGTVARGAVGPGTVPGTFSFGTVFGAGDPAAICSSAGFASVIASEWDSS